MGKRGERSQMVVAGGSRQMRSRRVALRKTGSTGGPCGHPPLPGQPFPSAPPAAAQNFPHDLPHLPHILHDLLSMPYLLPYNLLHDLLHNLLYDLLLHLLQDLLVGRGRLSWCGRQLLWRWKRTQSKARAHTKETSDPKTRASAKEDETKTGRLGSQ